ncbi:MAG: tetratricopeptide repeat protein [Armatimonadota bacterium]
MTASFCKYCGVSVDQTALCCSACGKSLQVSEQDGAQISDSQQLQVRQLLARARLCQQDGDLVAALRTAREALSLNPECNTIHALLGQLYEQSGNSSAARYHFQAALTVPPTSTDECSVEEIIPALLPQRAPQGRWMGPLLLACVLMSGLAVLFTFRPLGRHHDGASILVTPSQTNRTSPRWVWTVDIPRQADTKPGAGSQPATASQNTQSNGTMLVSKEDPTPSPPNPPAPSTSAPENVLGPSLHGRVVAKPTAASAEQADQAYFAGQYERAVTIYEKVIQREETPNPRLYQDLAWCYQQLGNSAKAAENLDHAMRGYKQALAENPDSSMAQQGLRSCEAAYRTLMLSRDQANP